MNKGHRTVFQNAWIQKNQHSHWKNNSVPKKLMNSYEKRPRNRSSKMPEAKKTNSLIENTIPFQKTYKFIWKNATEPSSKMTEAKKTNTFIEKTILFQKNL